MQTRTEHLPIAVRPQVAHLVVVVILTVLLALALPRFGLPYGRWDWTVHSQPYATPTPSATTVATPSATTVTIDAIADATLDEAVPAENQGDLDAVWVGQAEIQEPAARRGLLRFDLSSVPAGATIEHATLELYLGSAANRKDTKIAVFGVLDAWAEGEVSWDSAPALSGQLTAAEVGSESGYYAWDVTALAQGWHAGTFANHGLLLRDTDESTAVLRGFFSREAGTHTPRLVVTYTQAPPRPPTPTPAATQPATSTPTVTLTAALTPTPTSTPGLGVCDPADPAAACSATLTAQAFVDHRCDQAFILGVDRPISGATITVSMADGGPRTAVTNENGYATFVQLRAPAGTTLTVSIDYPPTGPDGTAVVPCQGSPETVPLTAADFGFGQFKYVLFRAQPATFGAP